MLQRGKMMLSDDDDDDDDDEITHMMVYFAYAREGSPRVKCQQMIYN
jgi:hypothetical protein